MTKLDRHYPRKAEIARMVAAVKAAGLDVGEVRLSPDGTIALLPAKAANDSAYDRWKAGTA